MIRCLLIGPPQEGGEGVYVKEVYENPPEGVSYSVSQQYHTAPDDARCNVTEEIMLNRLVHPFLRYGFGFRVLSINEDFDIVHVHSHPTMIHSQRRVPVVMSAGSSHYIYARDYEKWSERKIRRRYSLARAIYRPLGIHDELLNPDGVARIYTFSNWAREIYIRHGIAKEKVDVIYPGFEVPDISHNKEARDSVNFLFIGREFARKGGPLVVEAFARLREKNEKASLMVVTRDVDQVKRTPGVKALPFMSREKLYGEIYPSADVFVMPTEAEGWGFTNAEAMSFALPVITTNINAMPEIVEEGVTGLLIEPGDGESLLKAMMQLAEDADLRKEMGHRGREQFINCFSREVFRDRLREFYEAALKS